MRRYAPWLFAITITRIPLIARYPLRKRENPSTEKKICKLQLVKLLRRITNDGCLFLHRREALIMLRYTNANFLHHSSHCFITDNYVREACTNKLRNWCIYTIRTVRSTYSYADDSDLFLIPQARAVGVRDFVSLPPPRLGRNRGKIIARAPRHFD